MDEKKILLVVFDGIADRPARALSGKTPLQVARKPNFDWFAQHGALGLLDPIAPGVKPGSDTSHLALLGYDPETYYTGRGPFEAAGVGLAVKKGDVAFRCNFATVDKEWRVIDRRAGRIREGAHELAKAIEEVRVGDVRCLFRAGTEHRGALVLRGSGLSAAVEDVDPHELNAVVGPAKARAKEAAKTARVLSAFVKKAHDILEAHPVNEARRRKRLPPANIVLPRGGGLVPSIPPFPERYGMKGAAVAGVALIKGICRVLGLDVIEVDGATGGLDTDVGAKADAALDALRERDFVFVNVKAPDLCGHDGDAHEKIAAIQRLDPMFKLFRSGLGDDTILAVTSDHTTPVELGDHSGDPVPLLLWGDGVRSGGSPAFDEIVAGRGSLGRLRGLDLMPTLLDLANRNAKYGS